MEENRKPKEIGGFIPRRLLPDRTSDGEELWECECRSCGAIKTLRKSNIKKTRSCGCLKRIDITGKRFGRLVAVCATDKRDHRQVVWRFRCDCGTDVEKPVYLVTSGSIQSCGCLAREQAISNLRGGIAMGTNLHQICQEGDPPQRNNSSGQTGIWFDPSRRRYMVRMEFQGMLYRRYVYDESEAIQIRQMYVDHRHAFLDWWNSLSPEEQASENAQYQDEDTPMGPLFLDWVKKHVPPA